MNTYREMSSEFCDDFDEVDGAPCWPSHRVPLLGLPAEHLALMGEARDHKTLANVNEEFDSGFGKSLPSATSSVQFTTPREVCTEKVTKDDENPRVLSTGSVTDSGTCCHGECDTAGFLKGSGSPCEPRIAFDGMDTATSDRPTPLGLSLYDVYRQDEDGDTQLHIAISQKQAVITSFLICQTPDLWFLGIPNYLGHTPMHLAVITNQPEIVACLLGRGVAADCQDRHGNTPLHLASFLGFVDCVRVLASPARQDLSLRNYDGDTCAHLAAASGRCDVLALLVSGHNGAHVNCRDGRNGRTVLHHVADRGDFEMVNYLLSNVEGISVNATTFDARTTPLVLAAGRGHYNIVQLLITHGAIQLPPAMFSYDTSSGSDTDSDEERMGTLYTSWKRTLLIASC